MDCTFIIKKFISNNPDLDDQLLASPTNPYFSIILSNWEIKMHMQCMLLLKCISILFYEYT